MEGIVVVVVEGIVLVVVVVVIIIFFQLWFTAAKKGAKCYLENSVTLSCLSRAEQHRYCRYGSLTSIKSLSFSMMTCILILVTVQVTTALHLQCSVT